MKRTLFDNYDVDTYLDMAKESMEYNGIDDASEEEVWQCAGDLEQEDFTNTLDELKSFFDGKTVMFTGAVGRWCGNHTGFDVGDFDDLFSEYTKIVIILRFTTITEHFISVVHIMTALTFSRFSRLPIKESALLRTGKIIPANMQIAAMGTFTRFY